MSVIRDLKESDAQYPPEARIGSSALREAKIIVHTAQSATMSSDPRTANSWPSCETCSDRR